MLYILKGMQALCQQWPDPSLLCEHKRYCGICCMFYTLKSMQALCQQRRQEGCQAAGSCNAARGAVGDGRQRRVLMPSKQPKHLAMRGALC